MTGLTMTGHTASGQALSGLDALPAVSLGEITASAALLTRVDRKYVLTTSDLDELWCQLPRHTRALEIEGQRSVGYTSTYLDTPALTSYLDAAHRRRRRWKVRTRSYETGGDFLEVKTRRRTTTVKERIPWHDPMRLDPMELETAGRDFVETSLRSCGVVLDASTLAPALVTTYRRSTLLLGSGTRATLDLGLVWTAPETGAWMGFGDRVVFETKSAGTPSELDRLLWRHGHRPQRISKYAVGLAALHPNLPHNRWHRLLTRLAPESN